MAENKTAPTDQSVEAFLNAIEDERKRKDSFRLLDLMREVTGMEPQMWGSSIVGLAAITISMRVGARRHDTGRILAAQAEFDHLQYGRD